MQRSSIFKASTAMLCLVVPLAACTSSKPEATTSEAAAAPSAEASQAEVDKASKDYQLTFIQGVAGDEFYISMQCGIEAEAERLGVSVTTQGPQKFDPTLQKPIVDAAVAADPDAILIAPTDITAMQTPLSVAADAGIEVVLVDTTLEDPSIATSVIASDNVGGGKAAFEAIQQLAPEGGKVMVMSTDPGISTVDARVQGFEEAVAADPKFTYIGVQYSHNDPATASNLMSSGLQKDPDIVGVFATNLFAAEGTATGVRQAGAGEQVKIVAFDAGPNQVKALKDGTVQALIAQQPDQIGRFGVNAAVAALDGSEVTPNVQTDFTVITNDNIDGEGADAVYKSDC